MQPSKYQIAIFKAMRETNSSLLIKATAGSGKTTTILEGLKIVPKSKSAAFVSFSNTIVNELKSRVPHHVKATTLHSLGYSILKSNNPKLKVDEYKYFRQVLDKIRDSYDGVDEAENKKSRQKEIYIMCYQTIDIINAIRLTFSNLDNVEEIQSMCDHYGLITTPLLVSTAIEVVKSSLTNKSLYNIDFADMIYLPLVLKNLPLPKFDYIFYDEVQDANKAQVLFVERLLSYTGRLICVGDPYQAIYGFSFADINVMNYLEARKDTKVLPLSVCYRCGKSIVKEARRVNEEIEPFEGKEDGIVRFGDIEEIEEGDIVISRNTKPLIFVYFKLLKEGKRAKLLGRDYRDHLIRLYNGVSLEGSIDTDSIILENLDEELGKLKRQLIEKGKARPEEDDKYISLKEQTIILRILLKQYYPSEIIQRIKDMFDETQEGVTLMTIHRSKGLESNRVFFIQRSDGKKMLPSPSATLPWELEQERHLEFVGITRAKKELIYIANVNSTLL